MTAVSVKRSKILHLKVAPYLSWLPEGIFSSLGATEWSGEVTEGFQRTPNLRSTGHSSLLVRRRGRRHLFSLSPSGAPYHWYQAIEDKRKVSRGTN